MIAWSETLTNLPPTALLLAKITLLLAIAWLLHAASFRSNPRWRVMLWRVAMLGLCLLPVAEFAAPKLQMTLPAAPRVVPPVENVVETVEPADLANLQGFSTPVTIEETETIPPPPVTQSATGSPPEATSPTAAPIESAQPMPVRWSAEELWCLLWLYGSLILVIRLVIGSRVVHRLIADSEPAPPQLTTLVADAAASLGIVRPFQVKVTAESRSPFLAGVFRPVIVLPRQLVEQSDLTAMRAAIAHELAHLATRDLLWSCLSNWIATVLWFHPLIWRMQAAHRTACEHVADATAARLMGSAVVYSKTLAQMTLDLLIGPSLPQSVSMFRTAKISARLRRLTAGLTATRLTRRQVCVVSCFAAVMLAGLGSLTFGHGDPEETDSTTAEAKAAETDTQSPQSGSLTFKLKGGELKFLGLTKTGDESDSWWAPNGKLLDSPPEGVGELQDKGTLAAFQLPSGHELHSAYFLTIKGMLSAKKIWKGSAEGVTLASLEHPAGRRYANIFVSVFGPPWKTRQKFELTEDAVGKTVNLEQEGLKAVAGLRKVAPARFAMTIFHKNSVHRFNFAAIDADGKLHVPQVESQIRYEGSSSKLTFDFPLDSLREIIIRDPTISSLKVRNVAMSPELTTDPQFIDRASKTILAAANKVEPRPDALQVALPSGGVVELIGCVRYSASGLTWWAPDGSPLASPPKSVVEADVEGLGTMIAVGIRGAGHFSFMSFLEKQGKRVRVDESSYIAPEKFWIMHVDPSSKAERADLVLNVTGGKPELVAKFPLEAEDLQPGQRKSIDRDGVVSIKVEEPPRPDSCEVTITTSENRPGEDFVCLDKQGEIHQRRGGSFGGGTATIVFQVPISEVAAVAIERKRRAEAKISGISLQPGLKTDLQASATKLGVDPVKATESNIDRATADKLNSDFACTVVDADGNLLNGARVIVCPADSSTRIRQGERRSSGLIETRTVDFGQAVIALDLKPHALVVYHDRGYAIAPFDQVRKSGKVVVEPWSDLTGQFVIRDQLVAKETIEVMFVPLADHFREVRGSLSLTFKAQTDRHARFTFPRLPGLDGRIARHFVLKQTPPPNSGTMIGYHPARNLSLQPGKSSDITLGGKGRPLEGTLTLPDWVKTQHDLSWCFARLQRLHPEPFPGGRTRNRQSSWVRRNRQTPEGKKYWLAELDFSFRVNPDGTFRLEDVPPGEYELDVQFYAAPDDNGREYEQLMGAVKKAITVPKFPAGRQSEPHNLGEVEIDLIQPPATQDEAG